MHDLIQDMGRKLAKNTRLFLQGNAWKDLQNQKESNEIEGLVLDLTQSEEKQIHSQIFEKLPKLRLLEIFGALTIKGHFKNSFHELRCIYWSNCRWTQFPSSFRPQKLIYIGMPYSCFNILWNDLGPFMSLKIIDVSYSVNLKTTPDFSNSKLVERLIFGGCECLLKVHPSIRELTGLNYLELGECTHLKALPEPIGKFTMFGHLCTYSGVKRLPEPMTQWVNIGHLLLGHCSNLRRLPKQLGDMKGLKVINASHTAIKELPDSITQLKGLLKLQLSNCKKLRKLPEEIGNMEELKILRACYSAIENLPDSFVCLINLEKLYLSCCKNIRTLPNDIWKLKLLKVLYLGMCSQLERLPEKLGEMQCLIDLNASFTAIAEVPNSIGQLSGLRWLDLRNCKKLRYLPNSVSELTSLAHLNLLQPDSGRISLPDTVKYTRLVTLSLNCDTRSCLPMILSFLSLEKLVLCDEGKSLFSKQISLSKLYNLQYLELYKCTSFGSSFPELPCGLKHLCLCRNLDLVQLPNLSNLKQLKKLDIYSYISRESLPPLHPHIRSLRVHNCISLKDLPDMSMLKEQVHMSFGRCNLRSVNLNQSFLQIAEWFSYKSNGRTVCFDIPPLLGHKFLGLAIWVLFTTKNGSYFKIKVVVNNKTNGITEYQWIPVTCDLGAEIYSLVRCISADEISITSGDRIDISFGRQLFTFDGNAEAPYEEVKVKKCAAHVIQITPFTPDFPSVLNNFMIRA